MNDYRVNAKRSIDEVERRIRKHLQPYFGGRRLTTITTADMRAYVAQRQAETEQVRQAYDLVRTDGTVTRVPEQRRTIAGVSAAEINRELTILKRIFSLAIQAGKLLHRPHIPLLREDNVRTGFFEPEQFAAVHERLPAPLQPVIEFAYITGWRITSEVLPSNRGMWISAPGRSGSIRARRRTASGACSR